MEKRNKNKKDKKMSAGNPEASLLEESNAPKTGGLFSTHSLKNVINPPKNPFLTEKSPSRSIFALDVSESIQLDKTLIEMERIRNMLTPDSMEKVSKRVQEMVAEEKEEASRQRILIRQSSQEKIMEDAIQAFRSLEQIRELFSPEEFTELTEKASQFVRKEHIERAKQIRLGKLKDSMMNIYESHERIQRTFIQHRDEIQSKQPEKKRARKNSDSSSSSDA